MLQILKMILKQQWLQNHFFYDLQLSKKKAL
jgi:hypothetical protein